MTEMLAKPSSTQTSGFRTDINGLRAWAVVAVMLYHFGIAGFGGGFVGVDIFFVISGYLMTRIICSGLERDSFKLWQFYLARGRRIIPALLVLCAMLLLLGWFMLPPVDYQQLASEMRAALGFYSNNKFAHDAGYFDTASHEKWLLHTWSLSLEWQFYLVLPLALWALWRLRPNMRFLLFACMAGALASLIWSIARTNSHPTEAFYMLPTRAWEMLAGGIVFLGMRRAALPDKVAKIAEWTGFALIVFSISGLSAQTPWPSAWALLPVGGTVLVLMAARSGSMWTSSRIAQWLGTCSYSLYLWHWPMVVGLAYMGKQAVPEAIAAGLVLSFLLGWLSWRWVEEPARRVRWGSMKTAIVLLVAVGVVATAAGLVRWKKGVESRFPQITNQEAQNKNSRTDECLKQNLAVPACTYGGPDLGAIVIGDSHAATIVRAVEHALPSKNSHVLDWTLSACPTIQGIQGTETYKACPLFVPQALGQSKSLTKQAPLIILNRLSFYLFGHLNEKNEEFLFYYFGDQPVRLTERTTAYEAQFRQSVIDTACEFAQDRPVYMVRPIPEMPVDVPRMISRRLLWTGETPEISISLQEYHARHAFAWEAQDAAAAKCGVKILDPLPYLCWDGRCHGTKDGRALYYDDDHLSETGAALLAPMFAEIFAQPN